MDLQALLQNNKQYAATHTPVKTIPEGFQLAPKTYVVSCADPRSIPEKFMKLDLEDGVVVGRCMGGRVSEQILSIASLDTLLKFEHLMIIHHTDCGASHLKPDGIRQAFKALGADAAKVDDLEMLTFTDFATSVRDDIALVKNSDLFRKELKDATRGYIYDIKTGLLTEVTP